MTPVTKLLTLNGFSTPPGAWVLSNGFANAQGQFLGAGLDQHSVPQACRTAFPGGNGLREQRLSAHGYHLLVTYQPHSRFWAFPGIETGIFLVLAVALVAFASWRVLTRDA
jgi:hypothetical protein